MEKAFTLQEQRLDGKTNRSVITIGFLYFVLHGILLHCILLFIHQMLRQVFL